MANPLYDALLGRHAGSCAPFLILPNGESVSYENFLALAARFANTIVAAGVGPGDRLAMQVAKTPEALAVYAACVQAGVIFLPLNTAYTADEVDYFVDNSGACLLVCDADKRDSLSPVSKRHGARLETLNSDGSGTLSELASCQTSAFDPVARGSDDVAALLYTSGTTGRSKGAMLTHGNLLSNAGVLAAHWRFSPDDVLLHALPIFHTHGLFVATNVSLVAGSSMIFLPVFDVQAIIARMRRATVMMGVPTFYTRLLRNPDFSRETTSGVRLFVSGSAPLLAETHIEFEKRTGHRILERYGMTETNMITSNPYDGERRAGTVGFALPGITVRIRSKGSDNPVQTGDLGMIEVLGPNVFPGYWRMPDRTKEEFTEDGYFVTGDLGRFDDDGYLEIAGRGKDLVISGGFNIYPREIEQVLDEQDHIEESAVIGVPHADYGEGVVAVLVPKKGATIDIEQVNAAVTVRLARFKQPKKYLIVNELPRNTMGKVQKNVLRDRYGTLFSLDEA